MHLHHRARPLRHGNRDRLVRAGADGLQHACVAERGDIAAFLQLEAVLIDAAGRIDREHELQVGRGLRGRRHDADARAQHRRDEGDKRV